MKRLRGIIKRVIRREGIVGRAQCVTRDRAIRYSLGIASCRLAPHAVTTIRHPKLMENRVAMNCETRKRGRS